MIYHDLVRHHIDEGIHHLRWGIFTAGGAEEIGADPPMPILIAGDIPFIFWHPYTCFCFHTNAYFQFESRHKKLNFCLRIVWNSFCSLTSMFPKRL